MAGVNKTITLGRLGNDPELTYSAGGMAICKFSMATSRKMKDGQEKTSWHRFTAFNKSAELIGQYVKKGQELYVEGELSYGSYDKDGVTHYTTDIIVNQFNFISGGKQAGNQQGQGNQGYQQNNQGYSQNNGGQGYQDDSVPF